MREPNGFKPGSHGIPIVSTSQSTRPPTVANGERCHRAGVTDRVGWSVRGIPTRGTPRPVKSPEVISGQHPRAGAHCITMGVIADDRRPPRRPPHKPTGASLIVLICLGVTVVGIAVLHLVRRDLDPLHDVMSHYANGPNGPLMSIVFYGFGVSAIAMGVRLRSGMDRRPVTRPVPWLLVLAGSSLLVAGVFEVDRPTDPETAGELIHSNTAVAAFVFLVGAMLLFAVVCRHDERWWSMRWTALGLALIAAGAATATQLARDSGTAGGLQRVLAGTVLVWLVLVAVHVRRASFDAH
jgi:Protein of unknown function (DUF998)